MAAARARSRATRRPGATLAGALAAAALCVLVAPSRAGAQSPLPERDGVVANGTDLALSAARIDGEFRVAIGEPYGQDGLFLLVPDCRPDPEVFLDDALDAYGMAAADGELDDDALVWLVCTEAPRFAGFFWSDGNPYAGSFDEDAVVDAMIDQLADGNVTGALVDGIEVAAGAMAQAADGDGSVDADGSALAAAPAGAEVEEDGGIGGLPTWAVAVVIALLGYAWWRRSRRPAAPASSKAAPAGADPLAEALAGLDARLVESPPALARLILLHEPLGEAAMLALDARHRAMLARAAALRERAAGLAPPAKAPSELAEPPGSPEVLAATAAAEAYGAALAEARALLAYADGLPAEADHAERLIERAPVLAVEARKAIAAAAEAYGAVASAPELDPGLPSADAALAFPTRLVDLAEAALGEGRRLAAGELAEDAAALAERVAAVVAQLREAERAVDAARGTFDQVDDYAEPSWADIRGNGSEAEESLDAASARLVELAALSPDGLAEDPAAGFAEGLERIAAEIGRARALASAVEERLEAIRAARDGTPALIEALARELAEARAWLARPEVAGAAGDGVATLDALEAELDAARAAAGEPAPDWLAIRRRLVAVDAGIDAALGEARARQERVAARRRQLATERSEAEASLARAERYAAAHRSDVGSDASVRLAEARDAAARALEAERILEGGAGPLDTLLQTALDAWLEAERRADTAYEAAAGDVRTADARRESYRPRTDWLGPIVTVPVPRRSSGGGLFGGSGGFGGFGGGGASRSVPRPSAWGGRPSGGSGGSRRSGGGSSTRRGGGRGW